MNVRVVLKRLRESRGLTILELAEKSGTSNGAIGEIERGKTTPRQKTLEKISEALNLTEKEREELFLSILSDKLPKYSKVELFVRGHILTNDDLIKNVKYVYEGKTFEDDVHKDCFFIKLDSENSQMPKGGFLLIDPYQKEIINSKVYLIKYEEKEYLKRIIQTKKDIIVLKSLNNGTNDIYTQIEDIEIKGRAVKLNYEEDL